MLEHLVLDFARRVELTFWDVVISNKLRLLGELSNEPKLVAGKGDHR